MFTALYAENTGAIHRSIYLLLSGRKRLPHHLSFPFPSFLKKHLILTELELGVRVRNPAGHLRFLVSGNLKGSFHVTHGMTSERCLPHAAIKADATVM